MEKIIYLLFGNKLTTTQLDELNVLKVRQITPIPLAVTVCIALSQKNLTTNARKPFVSFFVNSVGLNGSSSLYFFQFCYECIVKGIDGSSPTVQSMLFNMITDAPFVELD
jgi:hypothetical protein